MLVFTNVCVTTTTTFGFVLAACFSGDHSRLDQLPGGFQKKILWVLLVGDILQARCPAWHPSQQCQCIEGISTDVCCFAGND